MRNLAPNTDYSLCIMNLTDNAFTRDHLGASQFKIVGYSSRLQQVMTRDAQLVMCVVRNAHAVL